MTLQTTIGFIGLGVMGGPMCRNMALKHGGRVVATDLDPASRSILDGTRAEFVGSLDEVVTQADMVFLSLPGGKQVAAGSARARCRSS